VVCSLLYYITPVKMSSKASQGAKARALRDRSNQVAEGVSEGVAKKQVSEAVRQ
jgi:hypothetical protein